ncbi:MAG: hypothetical protein IIU58_03890, partial [Clostridia bacterium]|nr:hypothetical protein [Clostridia bacterium]
MYFLSFVVPFYATTFPLEIKKETAIRFPDAFCRKSGVLRRGAPYLCRVKEKSRKLKRLFLDLCVISWINFFGRCAFFNASDQP